MDWFLVIAWACVGLGLFAGAYVFARNPASWVAAAMLIFDKMLPAIWAFVSKRKSAEDEAAWRKEQLTKPNPQPMPSKFPKRDR